jgi:N-acyl amino acid synthase of PEP-CTERM/exosortase system
MFDDYFEVFLADTAESKAIHYSIRYQVYCEEMGFENKEDFPMEQEFDEYDDHSAHFIVRNKQTSQWVGAMRLIYKNHRQLPIEKLCKLNEPMGNRKKYNTVELSRLCVLKEVRRRFNDIDPPHGLYDELKDEEYKSDNVKLLINHRRSNRSIIWGLLNAATVYCYSTGIKNWYFITTSALEKVLRKGQFNMLNIGEPCFHNGERFPFKKHVADTYKNEPWRKDYSRGYGLYSEIDVAKKVEAA